MKYAQNKILYIVLLSLLATNSAVLYLVNRIPEEITECVKAYLKKDTVVINKTTAAPVRQTGNLIYLELTIKHESKLISAEYAKRTDWSDEFYSGYFTCYSSVDKGDFLIFTKSKCVTPVISGQFISLGLGTFEVDEGMYSEMLVPVIQKSNSSIVKIQ